MPRAITAIRNYVELSRLSNAPTVITNVLVGVSLAGHETFPDPVTITRITLSMLLFYFAGMALNDVVDAPLDAGERPERPIPSGRISRRSALVFTVACFALAFALIIPFGRYAFYQAFGLGMFIVLYDVYHKRWSGSVLLMGACRSSVYLCAGAALVWPLPWSIAAPAAVAILLYIVLLTLIARMETSKSPGRRARLALLLPVPILVLWVFIPPDTMSLPIICGVVLTVWLTFTTLNLFRTPPRIGPAIHGWLAGICLVDAYILSLLAVPVAVFICFACFGLTLLGHRFIMGT